MVCMYKTMGLFVFILCGVLCFSEDKKLGVPERGVQLIWEQSAEVDIGSVKIYRRAMDHRVNADLREVPWTLLQTLPPDVIHWRDRTAQVSVTYEYKITVVNTSGEEAEGTVIKVSVPNEKTPEGAKDFRVNAFDPMPEE